MVARNRELERGDAARRALVAAAVDLFADKGFAETATSEIVNRAGLTRAALYHHFADKYELFEAAVSSVESRVRIRVRGACQQAAGARDDPLAGLLAGAGAFLDECLEPDVQRLLLRDAPLVLGWQRLDNALSPLVEILAAAVRGGGLPPQPVEPLAQLLHGALVRAGLVLGSARQPALTRDELDAAVRQLLGSLFSGDSSR
ncbi:TetR/AcrR family transcriptional regulator [Prauserella cavernicola]|uniref:TetR/AcrR family transcriptional regulator n=1 Tax=Prauserella cavernicola TaxID=2800127 RepID=A0A934V5B5_9PSEU|nr:TetR/AcrR family transcriptional regulator [Prauserella cavernicola]MBK1786312.1 TetR/AcrR family transcriptional regulator [Prauserella cavernicola]